MKYSRIRIDVIGTVKQDNYEFAKKWRDTLSAYHWPLIAAITLIIIQTFLIGLLLAERSGRRTAQATERKTTELSRSVLNSVQAKVCILNGDGIIVAINDSWKQAETGSMHPFINTQIGNHYSQELSLIGHEDRQTVKAIKGIESVLHGNRNHFSIESAYFSSNKQQWMEMSVEPLKTRAGGVVIFYHDVTERRNREIEAQEHHRELAHVSRASAMGELASSLAHELNQPLAAILSNAQAATRYLDLDPPNLKEVRDALKDVVEDDARAAEIIQGMRRLLKKEEAQLALLDVNDVVKSVIRLAGNEAMLRKVDVVLGLADSLSPIHGDYVQLQQVVLNLLMNALDATCEQPDQRTVLLKTLQLDSEVHLQICDSGKGITLDQMKSIFDPFFTTKREGLGMGLSISKSIVQAHGGRIWAESPGKNGTMFCCAFPTTAISRAS